MLRFLLTRFSLIIPTFIGMTLVAFFLIRMVPGDRSKPWRVNAELTLQDTPPCSRSTDWTSPCWCNTAFTSVACCKATWGNPSSP